MFCPNCGKQVDDNATFCKFCGTKIHVDNDDQNTVSNKSTEASDKNIAPKNNNKKLLMPVCIAVIAIVAFFVVGNQLYNPQKIAEEYFIAVNNKDFSRAYDYLELPEGTLLTKDNYLTANSDNNTYQADGYRIDSIETDNKQYRNYNVTFYSNGSPDENTENIQLVADQSRMLFFHTWKVIPSNDIITDQYTIQVPSIANVTLDGQDITAISSAPSRTKGDILVTYKLPLVFTGKHELVMNVPKCEGLSYALDVQPGGNTKVSLDNLQLTKDATKELTELSVEFIKAYYTTVHNQGTYSDLINSLSIPYMDTFDVKDDYEYNYPNNNSSTRVILDSKVMNNIVGSMGRADIIPSTDKDFLRAFFTIDCNDEISEYLRYTDLPDFDLSGNIESKYSFSYYLINGSWYLEDFREGSLDVLSLNSKVEPATYDYPDTVTIGDPSISTINKSDYVDINSSNPDTSHNDDTTNNSDSTNTSSNDVPNSNIEDGKYEKYLTNAGFDLNDFNGDSTYFWFVYSRMKAIDDYLGLKNVDDLREYVRSNITISSKYTVEDIDPEALSEIIAEYQENADFENHCLEVLSDAIGSDSANYVYEGNPFGDSLVPILHDDY